MPVTQRRGDHLVGEVLHDGDAVDDVDVASAAVEVLRDEVLQVGSRVQHPRAGQHTAGDVDRGQGVDPRGDGGGEIARAAPDVEDVVVREQVATEQVMGEDDATAPVTLGRGVAVMLVRLEVVRAEREQPQGHASAVPGWRRCQQYRHPPGAQKVLRAGCGEGVARQGAKPTTERGWTAGHARRPLGHRRHRTCHRAPDRRTSTATTAVEDHQTRLSPRVLMRTLTVNNRRGSARRPRCSAPAERFIPGSRAASGSATDDAAWTASWTRSGGSAPG